MAHTDGREDLVPPVLLTPEQEYHLRWWANREASGGASNRPQFEEWDYGLPIGKYVDRGLDRKRLKKEFLLGQTPLWNCPANARIEPYVVKIAKVPKEVFDQLIHRYLGEKLYGGGGNAGEGFIKVPKYEDKLHFTDGTRLFIGQCPAIAAQKATDTGGAPNKPPGFAPRPTMRTDHDLTVKMFVLLLYWIEFEMPSIYGPRHYVPLCDLLFQGLCTCRPWIRDYDKWWMIKTFNHCFTLSKRIGDERELRVHPAKPEDMVLFKDENLILTFESQHGKQEREATRRKGIEERIENLSKQVYANYFEKLGPSFSNPDDTGLQKILDENVSEETRPLKAPEPGVAIAPTSYTVASYDKKIMTLSSGYGEIDPEKLPSVLRKEASDISENLKREVGFKEDEKRAKSTTSETLLQKHGHRLPEMSVSLYRLAHEAGWIVRPLIDERLEAKALISRDFGYIEQCNRPVDALARALTPGATVRKVTDISDRFPSKPSGTGSSQSTPHEAFANEFSTPLNRPKMFFKELPQLGEGFDVSRVLFQIGNEIVHNYHAKGFVHGNIGLHTIAVLYPPGTSHAACALGNEIRYAKFRLIPSPESHFSFTNEEDRVRTAAIAHDIGDFCFLALQLLYPEIALVCNDDALKKLLDIREALTKEQADRNRRIQAQHSLEVMKQVMRVIEIEERITSWYDYTSQKDQENTSLCSGAGPMGFFFFKNLLQATDAITLCAASRSTEPRVKVMGAQLGKIEGLVHLGECVKFFPPPSVDPPRKVDTGIGICSLVSSLEKQLGSSFSRKLCLETIRNTLAKIWKHGPLRVVRSDSPLATLVEEDEYATSVSLSSFYSVNEIMMNSSTKRFFIALMNLYDEHLDHTAEGHDQEADLWYETCDSEMQWDFEQLCASQNLTLSATVFRIRDAEADQRHHQPEELSVAH